MQLSLHDRLEFCLHQRLGESGAQLDDRLERVWMGDLVYLIFDPLQARDFCVSTWTLDQKRRSRWYVGGGSLTWQVAEQSVQPQDPHKLATT